MAGDWQEKFVWHKIGRIFRLTTEVPWNTASSINPPSFWLFFRFHHRTKSKNDYLFCVRFTELLFTFVSILVFSPFHFRVQIKRIFSLFNRIWQTEGNRICSHLHTKLPSHPLLFVRCQLEIVGFLPIVKIESMSMAQLWAPFSGGKRFFCSIYVQYLLEKSVAFSFDSLSVSHSDNLTVMKAFQLTFWQWNWFHTQQTIYRRHLISNEEKYRCYLTLCRFRIGMEYVCNKLIGWHCQKVEVSNVENHSQITLGTTNNQNIALNMHEVNVIKMQTTFSRNGCNVQILFYCTNSRSSLKLDVPENILLSWIRMHSLIQFFFV